MLKLKGDDPCSGGSFTRKNRLKSCSKAVLQGGVVSHQRFYCHSQSPSQQNILDLMRLAKADQHPKTEKEGNKKDRQ